MGNTSNILEQWKNESSQPEKYETLIKEGFVVEKEKHLDSYQVFRGQKEPLLKDLSLSKCRATLENLYELFFKQE